MCTWNSQALLASHHSARARAVDKMKQWKQLVGSHDLVATQETHGTEMDVHTMDRECGTHLHFLSTIQDRSAGGVCPPICKKFLAKFNFHFVVPILLGRALRLRADGPEGSLDVFNLHLDPNMDSVQLRHLLDEITSNMDREREVLTVIIGDLNIAMPGDPKMRLSDGTLRFEEGRFAKWVNLSFKAFADISGDYFTHRAKLADETYVLSKIDRC